MRKLTILFGILSLLILPSPIQASSYTKHTKLDYVAINNVVIEDKEEEGFLKVKDRDAVKIAGFADPNQKIRVSFIDKEYTTVADDNGNWFVLFSVCNIQKGNYPVKISFGDSEDSEDLIELVVNDAIKQRLDVQRLNTEAGATELQVYISLGILLLVTLVSITFYLRLKSLKKAKGKNKR